MRSTPPTMSARAALDRLTYGALDWPGKTVRLEPDSGTAVLQRRATGGLGVAELYHLNSELAPETAGTLLAARVDLHAFRREAVAREAPPGRPVRALGSLGELLAELPKAIEPDLAYGIELRLLADRAMSAVDPATGHLSRIATLPDALAAEVASAVRPLGAARPTSRTIDGATAECVRLLLIGRLARQEILYGPRGYRRALVEAGRVAGELTRRAAGRGWRVALVTEFADRVINAAALVDGIEDACLAIVELCPESAS